MATGPVVSIRVLLDEDRIEVTLRPGFTRKELDVVRALPGRKYDAERRIWTARNGRAAITTLTTALGVDGVLVTAGSDPATAEAPHNSPRIRPSGARPTSWNSSSGRGSPGVTRTRS